MKKFVFLSLSCISINLIGQNKVNPNLFGFRTSLAFVFFDIQDSVFMNEVTESQKEIISEFTFFENWMDKYQYIIDLGRRMSPLSEEEKKNENFFDLPCLFFCSKKKATKYELRYNHVVEI